MTFALYAFGPSFDSADRSLSYPFARFGHHKHCGTSTYGALLARHHRLAVQCAPQDLGKASPNAASL